jgi:hypothetical protein
MRSTILLICIALLASLGGATSAQAMTRAEVLAECPDFDRAMACPGVAEEFLQSLPSGGKSNQEIFDVAIAISDAVEPETVPLEVCLDAQEGVKVLAGGLKADGREAELLARAADMCMDDTVTGSIGGPNGGGGPPVIDPVPPPVDDCISPGNSNCAGRSEDSNYNPTALK